MSNRDDKANQPEEPDGVYPVAPPDPEVVDYKPSVYPIADMEPPGPQPREEGRFQYSLAELLLAVSVASLFMGILGLFPGGYTAANFAGLAGLGVLLSLVVLTVLQPTRPIIRLSWWAMLVIYALACVVAIIQG
jgi:hypothetical protein